MQVVQPELAFVGGSDVTSRSHPFLLPFQLNTTAGRPKSKKSEALLSVSSFGRPRAVISSLITSLVGSVLRTPGWKETCTLPTGFSDSSNLNRIWIEALSRCASNPSLRRPLH